MNPYQLASRMRRLPSGSSVAPPAGTGSTTRMRLGAFDDVRVGDDIAVGIDHHSGADGALPHDERGFGSSVFFMGP